MLTLLVGCKAWENWDDIYSHSHSGLHNNAIACMIEFL